MAQDNYRGPGGRHPGQLPLRGRAGHWTFNQSGRLTFAAGGGGGVIRTTTWRTPVFDLRYNLGDVDGFGQQRQKNIEANVLLGIDFNLFLRLDITYPGTPALYFGAFKFYTIESGNPMDPNKIRALQTRRDMTTDVVSGATIGTTELSSTLLWTPPGPLRYWQVEIVCEQVSATDLVGNPITTLPVIQVTGALH